MESKRSLPVNFPQSATPKSAHTGNADKGSKAQQPQAKQRPELNVALPSSGNGGGALRSISGKFDVNAANGTMSLSLPIHVSPGRGGFTPEVNLSYDSGQGNGPFGLGWNVHTSQIFRKISKEVPRYNHDDSFVHSEFDDLVPVVRALTGNALQYEERELDGHLVRFFRPRIQHANVRIERWTNLSDHEDIHWRTLSLDNVTTIFGLSNRD